MKALKSNIERARLAKVFMIVITAATVPMLGLEIYGYFLVGDVAADGAYTIEEIVRLEEYDLMTGGFALFYIVVQILTIIFFIMWFRRAYYNLHQLVSGLKRPEGWAAGGWFIPIMSFFIPFQIASDLYKRTESLLVNAEIKTDSKRMRNILVWWWGLWVASNIAGYGQSDESLEDIQFQLIFDMISSILTIGSGVLAIYVIRNYHLMEVELKNLEDVSQVNPGEEELLDSI